MADPETEFWRESDTTPMLVRSASSEAAPMPV
jgi:hypothetical protein